MGTDNTNNYLRPSNDIKIMLNDENKLGQVDIEWRIGLAMFKQNHFSEAIKHFNVVLNLSSGNLLAQEFRAKAEQNISKDIPFTVETESMSEITGTENATNETDNAVKSMGLSFNIIIYAIVIPIVIILLSFILILFLIRRRKILRTKRLIQPVVELSEEKKQLEDQSDILHCHSCGIDVETGQIICHNCGVKLKKSS